MPPIRLSVRQVVNGSVVVDVAVLPATGAPSTSESASLESGAIAQHVLAELTQSPLLSLLNLSFPVTNATVVESHMGIVIACNATYAMEDLDGVASACAAPPAQVVSPTTSSSQSGSSLTLIIAIPVSVGGFLVFVAVIFFIWKRCRSRTVPVVSPGGTFVDVNQHTSHRVLLVRGKPKRR